MPKGPRGEKRPAGLIGNAVKVARIATGEEQDERKATASAAATLGTLGGEARARNLTVERRVEIAPANQAWEPLETVRYPVPHPSQHANPSKTSVPRDTGSHPVSHHHCARKSPR